MTKITAIHGANVLVNLIGLNIVAYAGWYYHVSNWVYIPVSTAFIWWSAAKFRMVTVKYEE